MKDGTTAQRMEALIGRMEVALARLEAIVSVVTPRGGAIGGASDAPVYSVKEDEEQIEKILKHWREMEEPNPSLEALERMQAENG